MKKFATFIRRGCAMEWKFRAQCVYCKQWHFGAVTPDGKHLITDEPFAKAVKLIRPGTVGVFVGDDVVGNEIYTGDVVELQVPNDDVEDPVIIERYEVYFDEEKMRFMMRGGDTKFPPECDNFGKMIVDFNIRVVGNVFDNPDIVLGVIK